jgi:hypothetical protein
MKRITQILASMLFGAGGLLVAATAASAHSNIVSSYINCDTTSGTENVTWYVANDWNLSEVATVEPAAYPIFPSSVDIAASPSTVDESKGTVQERFVGDPSGTFSITVDGVWSDGYTQSATGYVTLMGDCLVTPPTTVAPVTPPTTIAPVPTTVPAPVAPAPIVPVAATPAPAVTPMTIAPAPVTTVAPITTLSPVRHRPAHKVIKAGAPIPQATAVHTGEPFAGTGPLVVAVSAFGLGLLGLGLAMRRRVAR